MSTRAPSSSHSFIEVASGARKPEPRSAPPAAFAAASVWERSRFETLRHLRPSSFKGSISRPLRPSSAELTSAGATYSSAGARKKAPFSLRREAVESTSA